MGWASSSKVYPQFEHFQLGIHSPPSQWSVLRHQLLWVVCSCFPAAFPCPTRQGQRSKVRHLSTIGAIQISLTDDNELPATDNVQFYSASPASPPALRLASSRSIIKRPPLASPINLSCSKTPPTLSSSSTCSETNHCRKILVA